VHNNIQYYRSSGMLFITLPAELTNHISEYGDVETKLALYETVLPFGSQAHKEWILCSQDDAFVTGLAGKYLFIHDAIKDKLVTIVVYCNSSEWSNIFSSGSMDIRTNEYTIEIRPVYHIAFDSTQPLYYGEISYDNCSVKIIRKGKYGNKYEKIPLHPANEPPQIPTEFRDHFAQKYPEFDKYGLPAAYISHQTMHEKYGNITTNQKLRDLLLLACHYCYNYGQKSYTYSLALMNIISPQNELQDRKYSSMCFINDSLIKDSRTLINNQTRRRITQNEIDKEIQEYVRLFRKRMYDTGCEQRKDWSYPDDEPQRKLSGYSRYVKKTHVKAKRKSQKMHPKNGRFRSRKKR
jgi:hypothetical protein